MSSSTDAKAPPSSKAEAAKPPPAPAPAPQQNERPPQTEELLCTMCGMRSCWR